MLQELILFLFPHIKQDSIIKCYKNIEYEKGDIVIQVGCIKKYVSIKMGHKNSIIQINKELNKPEIIKKAVNRFIIQGTQCHINKIDLLVYGTPDNFFFITPKEIHAYIMSKKDIESTAIHFFCLTFQPLSRVLNYNEKLEYMRNWIQIKWYNLEDNIIELMNKRYKKT